VAALRRESGSAAGAFYALHVRRGEFGVEEVKLSAEDMLRNLQFPNGTPIVPRGATVYIATDDPHGVCENCRAERKLCAEYYRRNVTAPLGCPADPSWAAFERFGWRIRFLHDFVAAGLLDGVAPSRHGMVEAVVCARAVAFAGTLYSTFTGFIHRLRGYHSGALCDFLISCPLPQQSPHPRLHLFSRHGGSHVLPQHGRSVSVATSRFFLARVLAGMARRLDRRRWSRHLTRWYMFCLKATRMFMVYKMYKTITWGVSLLIPLLQKSPPTPRPPGTFSQILRECC